METKIRLDGSAEADLFRLSLTRAHLRVLEDALDLYSRLGSGQTEIVAEKLSRFFLKETMEEGKTLWDIRDKYTDPMKKDLLGLPVGGSYGITSPNTHDRAKTAYEMQKLIQNKLVNPATNMTVWKDPPLKVSSLPLITVETDVR